ncbi:TonB-dependent receptor [Marinobacter nanhaiticus D15-8W]|uniref:Ferric aerobactin receptor n=1 Tax=Marinobacter nanhaiticus D15-8W TaxID=626887 RepID=N6X673_9GAMM|nr:TonB-dependent receptor [Marinobacter nanhaiticus]ENO16603.1 TonB-dependent receptor [Marinobacter nanhaiticus D15-8W]BES72401.1 TonB-dependent receptor [Marinobacter nanhaiticus D15-8W]
MNFGSRHPLSRGIKAVLGLSLMSTLPPVEAMESGAAKLDELVVVGTRTPTQISEVPGTVWVVEQEQLVEQVQAGKTLKQALGQLIPGLDVGPQGRTNYGQNMRGRSVLVMIDGVSLNSSRSVSRQFDSIDPFNIERIEVLSGATSLYGGGSTGGIINIITRKGESGGPHFTSQVGATSGFNDSDDLDTRVAQSVSGGTDRIQGRLGVALEKKGGQFDADGDQIKPDITQTDLQYNRSVDVTGNLGIELTSDQRLDITAQYYDSRYDGDRGLYLGEDFDAVTGVDRNAFAIRDGVDFDQEPATERYQVNLNYQAFDVLGHTFYAQAYTRSEEFSFHPFPYVKLNDSGAIRTGSYYSASKQNTDLSGMKLLLEREQDTWRFSYGADYSHETFDATQMLFDFDTAAETGGLVAQEADRVGRYPGITIDTFAPYFQAEKELTANWRISGGVRYERTWVEVDDFVDSDYQVMASQGLIGSAEAVPGGKNDYEEALFNLGTVYDLGGGQQVWANYSQGFELPDPAKFYGQGKYAMTGGEAVLVDSVNVEDSPLQAIKTDQVELGWRNSSEAWDAQVALYYAWSDKALSYDRDTLSVQVNEQKTRDYGVEASAVYRFAEYWEVGGTTHLTRSQQKVDGDWQDRAVTAASLSKVTGHVGWQDRLNQARLQGTRVIPLDDDAGQQIDGYTLFDLTGTRELPFGRLSLGISNLLDEDYSTIWGQRSVIFYSSYGPEEMFDYKGRGRTYTLTYTADY